MYNPGLIEGRWGTTPLAPPDNYRVLPEKMIERLVTVDGKSRFERVPRIFVRLGVQTNDLDFLLSYIEEQAKRLTDLDQVKSVFDAVSDDLALRMDYSKEPTANWDRYAAGKYQVCIVVAGEHYYRTVDVDDLRFNPTASARVADEIGTLMRRTLTKYYTERISK